MTDPIRSLLGDAIADAPPPPAFPATPITAPNHRGRWMAAAAAVVLIAGAVVAITVNHGNDHPATSPTTIGVTGPSTPAPTTAATSTTAPIDCQAIPVPASGYDGEGTVMTIVENSQPIDITVVPSTTTLCVQGTLSAKVTFHNRGAGTERLDYPSLLLRSDNFPKWGVDQMAPFTLAPGETMTFDETIQLPNVAPGKYWLGVNGFFGSEVPITVEGRTGPVCPPNCAPPSTSKTTVDPGPPSCGVHDLAAKEGTTESQMQIDYTAVTLTNTSSRTCYLDQGPWKIHGVDSAGRVHAIVNNGFDSTGLLKPFVDGLLAPGASVEFLMAMLTKCYLDPIPPKLVYPLLRLEWIGGVIDMPNSVDVSCGFGYSSGLLLPLDHSGGTVAAPRVCSDLAPTVAEHTSPTHWLEVTLMNDHSTPCRLTRPPTSASLPSAGDVAFWPGYGNWVAPPAPLGDGIAQPGESFWLGIDLSNCSATAPTQAWVLHWTGGTSAIQVSSTCTQADTTSLGFTRPHQDDVTGAKECTTNQFSADMAGGDGAMGNERSFIRLTRIGSGPCIAPAHPSIDLVAGTQRSHVQQTARLTDYLGRLDLAPTVLYPGDRADYVLVWGGPACDTTPPTVSEAIVTWAGGELHAPYLTGQQEAICPKSLTVSVLAIPPFSDQAP